MRPLPAPEDAHHHANRNDIPVFAFLQTVVMDPLRRGGYRSIRHGLRELAYDLEDLLKLGGVPMKCVSP